MKDKEGKPRGYAFIEFEREKDMKGPLADALGLGSAASLQVLTRAASPGPWPRPMGSSEAYKALDGLKIEGRRILVDVERGRTVKGWRPRRLGVPAFIALAHRERCWLTRTQTPRWRAARMGPQAGASARAACQRPARAAPAAQGSPQAGGASRTGGA